MTRRFDEKNIVDYLNNFNKNCIRPSKHSIFRHKERKLVLKDTIKFLTEKNPKIIKQYGSKEFSLIYDYDDKHCYHIVIAIKDKFINIETQYKLDKKRRLKYG
ncbi:MAG: hypothetical protein FWH54_00690 [Methanobrevibacter sp.]|nr:hypothetical protein [Methanobrevibacter sp.]